MPTGNLGAQSLELCTRWWGQRGGHERRASFQSSSGTNVLRCPQMTFMLPKHLIWRFNHLSDMWTPKLMLCYLGDTDWNSAQGSQGSPAERSAGSTLETVVHQLHDDGVTIKHSRGIPEMKSKMSTHLKRTLSLPRTMQKTEAYLIWSWIPLNYAWENILVKNSYFTLQTVSLISAITGREQESLSQHESCEFTHLFR